MLTRLNVVMILQYTHIKLLCCTPETNVYMSSIHQLKKRLKITELRIQLKKLEKGQQKSKEYRKKVVNKKIRIK